MPEPHIILAAREDARKRERQQRRRQEKGEGWTYETAYAYAVYDDRQQLVGFIHGHLTIRRMRRFRKRAKVAEQRILTFKQLLLAAGMST